MTVTLVVVVLGRWLWLCSGGGGVAVSVVMVVVTELVLLAVMVVVVVIVVVGRWWFLRYNVDITLRYGLICCLDAKKQESMAKNECKHFPLMLTLTLRKRIKGPQL